jgi:hypothetical protein
MAGKFKVRSEPVTTGWLAHYRSRRYYIINPEGIDTGIRFTHWDTAMFQANKWAQRRKVHAENRALWPV